MNKKYLLTIISNDKPGIVESIAARVVAHSGNWLESSLAQLGGKFAGVISVAIPESQESDFSAALEELTDSGIKIHLESAFELDQNSSVPQPNYQFSAAGPDRSGIIKELSKAFADKSINLQHLNTALSSMPYSGDPMFTASGEISVPAAVDLDQLKESLDDIADTLGLDFSLRSRD